MTFMPMDDEPMIEQGEDAMPKEEDFPLGGSADSRTSRLERKAESARQARLRHKQYVTDLQQQMHDMQLQLQAAQSRVRDLEGGQGGATAQQFATDLRTSLTSEQHQQLLQWLNDAPGGGGWVLSSLTAAADPVASSALALASLTAGQPNVTPPNTMQSSAASQPIAIAGQTFGGRRSLKADGDRVAHSWDDVEVARSILNLTPNGLHPTVPHSLPPDWALS